MTIDKWLEALRSKKYKQGTSYLCKNDKYCPLGVLTELCVEELKLSRLSGSDGVVFYNAECRTIPDVVATKFGISHELVMMVMRANDIRGLNFEEIADEIKEYVSDE